MIIMEITSSNKVTKMLWERKYFYLSGLLIGLLIVGINKLLGTNITFPEAVIVPISCSFPFGLLLYLFIKEPERAKREGRTIIFSREGLIHIALTFSSMLTLGILYKLISTILRA